MTAYTARALSTDRLQFVATELGNTFIVGDILGWDGTNYFLTDASTPNDSKVVGMVSLELPGDNFVITQEGYVTGLPGPLVPGTLYYLSTAIGSGALTATKPTGVGEVVLPCFIAHTATSGWFFASVGEEVMPPSQIPWITINSNQTLQINKNYWIQTGSPQLQLTMPGSMGTSDSISVGADNTSGGFKINTTAPQYINFVQLTSSVGGSLELTTTLGVIGGVATLGCNVTNTGFVVTSATGNYIVS